MVVAVDGGDYVLEGVVVCVKMLPSGCLVTVLGLMVVFWCFGLDFGWLGLLCWVGWFGLLCCDAGGLWVCDLRVWLVIWWFWVGVGSLVLLGCWMFEM